jgi:zinc-binding alcohol dehydrogenase/oxidoreductase
MKAIVLEGINQPLKLKEIEKPVVSTSDVLVALKAAALNHRDVWIRKGQYAGLKFPLIPGSDGAGTIVGVGENAGQDLIGRNVVINPGMDWGENPGAQSRSFKILGLPDDGTFAEFVKVPADYIYEMPAHLNFEQAAAIPLAGLTAFRALFTRAALKNGEKVLITGAGGGVALFALQFALAAGAEVYVTSGSDEKISRAVELGAANGVNYKNNTWDSELKKLAGAFNIIIDGTGGENFSKLTDLAAPSGKIVLYGATTGNSKGVDLRKIFWKQLNILGSTMGTPEDFSGMVRFIAEQKIIPIVDRVFNLEDADEAANRMEASGQFGKIVLKI